jgi:hypothetical protein
LQKKAAPKSSLILAFLTRLMKLVELGSDPQFTCPKKPCSETLDDNDSNEIDLSRLPVISADDRRDLLTKTLYIGKTVMKELWTSGIS